MQSDHAQKAWLQVESFPAAPRFGHRNILTFSIIKCFGNGMLACKGVSLQHMAESHIVESADSSK